MIQYVILVKGKARAWGPYDTILEADKGVRLLQRLPSGNAKSIVPLETVEAYLDRGASKFRKAM